MARASWGRGPGARCRAIRPPPHRELSLRTGSLAALRRAQSPLLGRPPVSVLLESPETAETSVSIDPSSAKCFQFAGQDIFPGSSTTGSRRSPTIPCSCGRRGPPSPGAGAMPSSTSKSPGWRRTFRAWRAQGRHGRPRGGGARKGFRARASSGGNARETRGRWRGAVATAGRGLRFGDRYLKRTELSMYAFND